jgi:actin-like ATPase involved in cell morphogenesis
MARTNTRNMEDVRRDIAVEREQLADAVEDLRAGIGEATNVNAKLRERLPVVAAGALATGFVVAGGIGATMRLFFRKGREGKTKARMGPFSFVDRR